MEFSNRSAGDRKAVVIMERETWFAHALAGEVLDKPKLSIWLILIPILFVFYFEQQRKYTQGRRAFAENYLKVRRRAVEAAAGGLQKGEPPDAMEVALSSDLPEATRRHYAPVLSLLIGHYTALLGAEGEDYAALVRAAYKGREAYLDFFGRLNRAEHDLFEALRPRLEETSEGVADIISRMEDASERLRLDEAGRIFG
ncbi:MAG: hypothetical protein Kow0025_15870 [Thermodesulfovibrionales bacterium]